MFYRARRINRVWPSLPTEAASAHGWLFVDIETTGLRPGRNRVTVVGVQHGGPTRRTLSQFFVDNPDEERDVLAATLARIRRARCVVTYNGNQFDLPFLAARCHSHGLGWISRPRLDLLGILRRSPIWCQALADLRLQTVMQHVGLVRTDTMNGLDMIRAYRKWVHAHDVETRNVILDHNADDVMWLPELASLLLAQRPTIHPPNPCGGEL